MSTPSRNEIDDALRRVARVGVAVFGDFAVDAYWDLEPEPEVRSIETGRPVQRVTGQRYGLGGAGNVAANLAALGAWVVPIGLCGDDPFGRELRAALAALRFDVGFMRDGPRGWQTVVYAKPHRNETEQDRIDLGAFNTLDDAARGRLIADLKAALRECGGVVLNQQRRSGVADPQVIGAICELVPRYEDRVFLVDARDHTAEFRRGILKINGHEALGLLGEVREPAQPVTVEEASDAASRLMSNRGDPLFVTLGAGGMIVASDGEVHEVAAVPVAGPVDAVGAGDTVAAALVACLASGCEPLLAAHVANLAAAVTVRKLQTTGTATPEEILELVEEES